MTTIRAKKSPIALRRPAPRRRGGDPGVLAAGDLADRFNTGWRQRTRCTIVSRQLRPEMIRHPAFAPADHPVPVGPQPAFRGPVTEQPQENDRDEDNPGNGNQGRFQMLQIAGRGNRHAGDRPPSTTKHVAIQATARFPLSCFWRKDTPQPHGLEGIWALMSLYMTNAIRLKTRASPT